MKKQRLLFFSFVLLFSFTICWSQSASHPWEFSLGLTLVDLYPTGDKENAIGEVGPLFESFFNANDHWNLGVPSVQLSRYIGSSFSLGLQGSLATIRNIEGLSDTSYSFFTSDVFLDFSPLQQHSIRPVLKLGYGLSQIKQNSNIPDPLLSKNTSKTVFGGIGFDVMLSEEVSLGVETSYRNAFEKYIPRHFQHNVVLHYAFGKKDSDGDGIPDSKDECPDLPGLKEFNGCPDTDGDKVPDKEDKCPDIPGSPELGGCVDSDGDGVVDPEDGCPQRPGSKEMKGCPDTDGDGISDADDVCMDQRGPLENSGCPWPDSDQDGIPDKDDLCVDKPGVTENKGCPELDSEIMKALNRFGARINFAADSDRILGQKTRAVLNEIIKLLRENPKGKISIEGYASSDGDSNYNIELSVKRAEAVLEYLVAGGIDLNRLQLRGYGEENPISTNQTPQGRAINRRVQFRTIKER